MKLWKTFTDCFNCLPVAAIIDEKILCMHGGLSPELNSMDQVRRIARPTDVPDTGQQKLLSGLFCSSRFACLLAAVLFIVLVVSVLFVFVRKQLVFFYCGFFVLCVLGVFVSSALFVCLRVSCPVCLPLSWRSFPSPLCFVCVFCLLILLFVLPVVVLIFASFVFVLLVCQFLLPSLGVSI